MKAGVSEAGRRAALAHTGSDADRTENHYDQMFREAGVVRVATLEELVDGSLALAHMPPLRGSNVAIVTNGGGPGLLAADELERRRMRIPDICRSSPRLDECLRPYVSPYGSCLNPIDLGAGVNADQVAAVVNLLLSEAAIDGILVSVAVTSITDLAGITKALVEIGRPNEWHKPLVAEVQGGADADAAILHLRRCGIPAYSNPERAAAALIALHRYGALQKHWNEEREMNSLSTVPAPQTWQNEADLASVGLNGEKR